MSSESQTLDLEPSVTFILFPVVVQPGFVLEAVPESPIYDRLALPPISITRLTGGGTSPHAASFNGKNHFIHHLSLTT